MSIYDPTVRLKEIFLGSAGKFEFSGSDAISSMVLIREMVELTDRRKDLAVLNLYCNWSVHPESLGSVAGCRFLTGAAEAYGAERDEYALHSHISESLSLSTLRTELIDIFQAHGLPTRNFELKTGWKMFCNQYFKSLQHKRLRFPVKLKNSPKAAELYRGMKKQAQSDTSRIIESIRFQTSTLSAVQWTVTFEDGTEVFGELHND